MDGTIKNVKNILGSAVQNNSTSFSSRYSLQFFFFEIFSKIQKDTAIKSREIISIIWSWNMFMCCI